MFEKFRAPACYINLASTLALYASGRHGGLVVDVGDGVTHITPHMGGKHLGVTYVTPHMNSKHFGVNNVTPHMGGKQLGVRYATPHISS